MATAAEFVTPKCSHSFSTPQSSGVGEDAIDMVTLNSQPSIMPSEGEKTMATVQSPSSTSCPSRTLSRQSSSSSMSSTDSCLDEAKYGHIHNQEFDFLLWFAESNVREANMIFEVLEKKQQLRGFRYDRDQTIGKVRFQIISEAIKKSWKILLLLSPEADKDRWFVHELTQSLTHDIITQSSGNVVPILLRKSRKDMPSYLGSISSLLFPTPMDNDQIDSTRTSSSSQLPSSPTSSSSRLPSSPTSSSPTYLREGSSNTDSYEDEFARFVESLINIFTPTPPIQRKRPSTSRSISRTSQSSSSSWSSSWRSTKSSTSSVSSSDSDSGSSSKSASRFAKFFQRK